MQLVHTSATFPLVITDLRHLSEHQQERVISETIEAERSRTLDLSQPPLLRLHVHLRDNETVQWTLTECHAILDGWSLHTILTEIFETYFALLESLSPVVAEPLTVTFRDFVALEQHAANSEESRRFWQQKLVNRPEASIPRLNGLDAQSVSEVHNGDTAPAFRSREILLDPKLCEGLERTARVLGVPLKSVLLAVHLKVLSFIDGQPDVITGLTCNGRPETGDGARVCGLFLNTLPLRLGVHPGTWEELVKQAFRAELELLPHRRYPLAQIQHEAGSGPLFHTTFNYTHFHVIGDLVRSGKLRYVGERIGADPTHRAEPTNFALVTGFLCNPASSGILLCLDYSSASLTESHVQRIGNYYAKALHAVVDDIGARHDIRSLLDENEEALILQEWNDTALPFPEQACLHELVEEQAARTPQSIAVIAEGDNTEQILSYERLIRGANHLAQQLQQAGVAPETRVAVFAERSAEMVIAVLGVLKAGGAYLPLDHEYPPERLRWMLEDCDPPFLVTTTGLVGQLPVYKGRIIVIESGLENPDPPESKDLDSSNLANIIYTSGSTGRPKGVMTSHRSLVNRLLWMQRNYNLGPDDKVLQKTTLGFDVSVWEIFWPLISGASLVLARPGGQRDPEYLGDLIRRRSITTVHFVPSMLQVFLDQLASEQLPSLRRVICSGEAMTVALEQNFHERLAAELHNLYGPTEAAIDVTAWACRRDGPASRSATVPIGKPIDNVSVYLLDSNMKPVSPGVPAEMYIGGVNLARGYHGRPDLTAAQFVPDPFARCPGLRLYKTGDIARHLDDGAIEFLGRRDRQIKLRGFRVEPQEIQETLLRHESVSECVITIIDGRLVAHVVPVGSFDLEKVREFAQTQLPDFMIPYEFLTLPSLPRTLSGKVDMMTLEQNAKASPRPDRPAVLPRTEVERAIAAAWCQVLDLDSVSVDTRFFEIGGHSLLLAQVHQLLRKSLNKAPSLTDMMRFPTISALGRHLCDIEQTSTTNRPSTSVGRPVRRRRTGSETTSRVADHVFEERRDG